MRTVYEVRVYRANDLDRVIRYEQDRHPMINTDDDRLPSESIIHKIQKLDDHVALIIVRHKINSDDVDLAVELYDDQLCANSDLDYMDDLDYACEATILIHADQ